MALLPSVLPTRVLRVLVAVMLCLVPSVPLVELSWIVIGSRAQVPKKLVTEEESACPDRTADNPPLLGARQLHGLTFASIRDVGNVTIPGPPLPLIRRV
jgi:hypothetical protein